MKKIIVVSIVLLLLFSCTKKTVKTHAVKELQHLTILYINDYHGHLTPFKAHFKDEHTVGGIARIATIIKKIRKENGEANISTLFLCAGDVLQGTPASTVFKGEPDIICLSKMGCNAMVVGNHEFDYGQENLNTLRKLAEFPILGANVYSERGQAPVMKGYFTRNIKGIRIHILGLVTDETPITTHPRNVKTLVFKDPIEIAIEILSKLDKGNLTIALTHLGYEVDKQLAKNTSGIDIIIGGHSHTKIETPVKVKNTVICQAFEYGEYVGRLDIDIENGKIARILGSLIPVTEEIEEDPEIKEIVDEYLVKLDKNLKEVIGIAEIPLNGEREDIRSKETNLGNLIADVMRQTGNTDIAFVNAGGIRASIDKGDITIEEVLTVLPYGNHLVTMSLSGSDIMNILNHLAKTEPGSGGFLQLSGIKVTIENNTVTSLGVGGKQLDLETSYTVTTNDFLSAGGDGYEMFKKGTHYIDTGLLISDIMIDYIKIHKTINAKLDGRLSTD
jgi:5'-nucleotidase